MIEDTFYLMTSAFIFSALIVFLAGYFVWWVSETITKKVMAHRHSQNIKKKIHFVKPDRGW